MTGEEVKRIRVATGADGFTYNFETKAKKKKADDVGARPPRSKPQPMGEAEAETVPAE
jgi:hypothetical protein